MFSQHNNNGINGRKIIMSTTLWIEYYSFGLIGIIQQYLSLVTTGTEPSWHFCTTHYGVGNFEIDHSNSKSVMEHARENRRLSALGRME